MRFLASASAVICLCLTSVAHAQSTTHHESKSTVDGKQVPLGTFMSLYPDCTSMGETVVQVLVPPQNGVVKIEDFADFPNFPKDNIRSACNGKRVPSMLAAYKPNSGFVGQDKMTILVITPAGGEFERTYSVNVRSLSPTSTTTSPTRLPPADTNRPQNRT